MRDDFGIFILSHGRANELTTAEAILDAGYTGKWFVVVDDLDEQVDDYIENYGDRVIVFNKREWAEKTDTITSTGELRSVVFARNACYDIAREKGLKLFAEFDDDIKLFQYRYGENGSLKGVQIRNLDAAISSMLDFQEASGAASVGFASSGGMIGGVNGRFREGLLRSIHQAFILRTDKPISFKGILNEDGIATEYCNTTGLLAFEVCEITQQCPVRATNSGGLNDLYKANNEYVRAFYSVIAYPSLLKIFNRGNSVTLRRSTDAAIPKIISDRWKK